jgi:hypothetical protein
MATIPNEAPPARTIAARTPIARSVLCFCLAFLAAASLIHILLPPPIGLYAAMRSEKLQILDDWSGKATTAAFGSSHVHNGFDPRAFDRALAGTPFATTSLNLGIEGGSQTEQRAMAEQFLSRLRPHPDQACFVLLELNAGANFTDDHLVHPRAINIYDWRTVRFVAGLASPALGRIRGAGRLAYALAASVLYYANVGMLSNLIFDRTLDQSMLDDETAADRRGLIELHIPHAYVEHQIAALPRSMTPEPAQMLPANYTLLSDLKHDSPVSRVHFIYWVTPLAFNLQSYPTYPSEITVDGVTAPILSVARPDLYPDLYLEQNWADDSHLSPQGAALASRYLAQQLSQWYKAHPQAMACGD